MAVAFEDYNTAGFEQIKPGKKYNTGNKSTGYTKIGATDHEDEKSLKVTSTTYGDQKSVSKGAAGKSGKGAGETSVTPYRHSFKGEAGMSSFTGELDVNPKFQKCKVVDKPNPYREFRFPFGSTRNEGIPAQSTIYRSEGEGQELTANHESFPRGIYSINNPRHVHTPYHVDPFDKSRSTAGDAPHGRKHVPEVHETNDYVTHMHIVGGFGNAQQVDRSNDVNYVHSQKKHVAENFNPRTDPFQLNPPGWASTPEYTNNSGLDKSGTGSWGSGSASKRYQYTWRGNNSTNVLNFNVADQEVQKEIDESKPKFALKINRDRNGETMPIGLQTDKPRKTKTVHRLVAPFARDGQLEDFERRTVSRKTKNEQLAAGHTRPIITGEGSDVPDMDASFGDKSLNSLTVGSERRMLRDDVNGSLSRARLTGKWDDKNDYYDYDNYVNEPPPIHKAEGKSMKIPANAKFEHLNDAGQVVRERKSMAGDAWREFDRSTHNPLNMARSRHNKDLVRPTAGEMAPFAREGDAYFVSEQKHRNGVRVGAQKPSEVMEGNYGIDVSPGHVVGEEGHVKKSTHQWFV